MDFEKEDALNLILKEMIEVIFEINEENKMVENEIIISTQNINNSFNYLVALMEKKLKISSRIIFLKPI